MTSPLRSKLKGQQGASLLIALLFLFICVMVCTSILVAAVANVGKHRSNLNEHQMYLAISSGISLLCEELNQAEYCGQYQYKEEEIPIYNEEEPPVQIGTKILKHFHQVTGTYSSAMDDFLLAGFDGLFGEEIRATLSFDEFESISTLPPAILDHTLTIQPATGTSLDTQEIHVTLHVVEESYAIELTASLEDYRLKAELTPITSKPTLPPLVSSDAVQSTDPLRWKIGWITVDEEETEP